MKGCEAGATAMRVAHLLANVKSAEEAKSFEIVETKQSLLCEFLDLNYDSSSMLSIQETLNLLFIKKKVGTKKMQREAVCLTEELQFRQGCSSKPSAKCHDDATCSDTESLGGTPSSSDCSSNVLVDMPADRGN